MNILLVLAHPDNNSFNHAIANAVRSALVEDSHKVIFHDLYKEQFDPLITASELSKDCLLPPRIRECCEELQTADGIVLVHPNWWGQPPAIMKGWIDRIFRAGVAYKFVEGDGGEGVPVGLLKAKATLILNTSNTPDARELSAFGDPLESIWKRCIFDLCGVQNVQRRTFNVIVTSSTEQRQRWLREAQDLARSLFCKTN